MNQKEEKTFEQIWKDAEDMGLEAADILDLFDYFRQSLDLLNEHLETETTAYLLLAEKLFYRFSNWVEDTHSERLDEDFSDEDPGSFLGNLDED